MAISKILSTVSSASTSSSSSLQSNQVGTALNTLYSQSATTTDSSGSFTTSQSVQEAVAQIEFNAGQAASVGNITGAQQSGIDGAAERVATASSASQFASAISELANLTGQQGLDAYNPDTQAFEDWCRTDDPTGSQLNSAAASNALASNPSYTPDDDNGGENGLPTTSSATSGGNNAATSPSNSMSTSSTSSPNSIAAPTAAQAGEAAARLGLMPPNPSYTPSSKATDANTPDDPSTKADLQTLWAYQKATTPESLPVFADYVANNLGGGKAMTSAQVGAILGGSTSSGASSTPSSSNTSNSSNSSPRGAKAADEAAARLGLTPPSAGYTPSSAATDSNRPEDVPTQYDLQALWKYVQNSDSAQSLTQFSLSVASSLGGGKSMNASQVASIVTFNDPMTPSTGSDPFAQAPAAGTLLDLKQIVPGTAAAIAAAAPNTQTKATGDGGIVVFTPASGNTPASMALFNEQGQQKAPSTGTQSLPNGPGTVALANGSFINYDANGMTVDATNNNPTTPSSFDADGKFSANSGTTPGSITNSNATSMNALVSATSALPANSDLAKAVSALGGLSDHTYVKNIGNGNYVLFNQQNGISQFATFSALGQRTMPTSGLQTIDPNQNNGNGTVSIGNNLFINFGLGGLTVDSTNKNDGNPLTIKDDGTLAVSSSSSSSDSGSEPSASITSDDNSDPSSPQM